MIGQTVSHYRIVEKLGQGGMGVVYRAEDTNLNRQVAIKVLPDIFSGNPERVARFEREAKLLASLNHPNIAAIHGLEQAEGKRFLVLELVEGETLAQRIAKGPLPVDEALEICRQIAEGVEAAHEKGIIHRDLKPANVKITPEGKVKVLDFGLAKAFQGEMAAADASHSPTLTDQMTRPGLILGTAAYMSPEQAKGKAVDKRADIWAFGCVLYECLTGKRAFEGETVTETLAAILKGEPDWDALPALTPWKARDLIRRCVVRDLRERLHDIADARIEIAEASDEMIAEAGVRPSQSGIRWRLAIPLLLVAVLIGAVAGLLILSKTKPSFLAEMVANPAGRNRPGVSSRMTIRLQEEWPLSPVGSAPLGVGRPALAISPDGSYLVYSGERERETQLYKRRLDSINWEPIPGTSGAYNPFFSPDGKWIGFLVRNQLKKISIGGGQPTLLCEAVNCYGATWADDKRIYFAPREGKLLCSVSEDGGLLNPEMLIDFTKDIWGFNWPHALPGGKGILCGNYLLSLPSKEMKRLTDRISYQVQDTQYMSSGHIVFSIDGRLMAAPFDLNRLETTGAPQVVLEDVRTETFGGAHCALTADGMLVYVSGKPGSVGRPVFVHWGGKIDELPFAPNKYGALRISPDGRKFAVSIGGTSYLIWIYDLALKGEPMRLSREENEIRPIWRMPDGSQITYFALENGNLGNVFYRRSNGSGERQYLIKTNKLLLEPESWSRNGTLLSLQELSITGTTIIHVFDSKTQELKPFLANKFNVWGSAFSPDGEWIAYTSEESGDYEVHLQQYPQGRHVTVSTGGGNEEPVWSRDGGKLFYRNGRRWLCATDPTNLKFSPGDHQLVFQGDYINVAGVSYGVMPDGERFLVLQPAENLRPVELHVILNWFEELKRLVPNGKH